MNDSGALPKTLSVSEEIDEDVSNDGDEGEVSVVVEVYKDKKFLEEKTLTFNSKNKEENFKWFATYFPKKIKSIGVAPYPKEGQIVKPKKQYIQIVFMD